MNREAWRIAREIMGETLGSGKPDAASVQRFMVRYNEAQAQGMAWPDLLADEALHRLVFVEQKNIAKSSSLGAVRHRGSVVQKPMRVGAVVRDEESGAKHYEQLMFDGMDWGQVSKWEAMIRSQDEALRVYLTVAAKLEELHKKFPDSEGPADAAEQLGMSLAEWLAS